MRALIFGRAKGVWEEVEAAQQLCSYDAITAVGRSGIDYPGPIDHWVTWHSLNFALWVTQRREKGYPDVGKLWSGIHRKVKQPATPNLELHHVPCDGGSSGMLAVAVNLSVGATHIVLAGIPMDPERGHYDEDRRWVDGANYLDSWTKFKPQMDGKVKSMSGWTNALLGGPTQEWLFTLG